MKLSLLTALVLCIGLWTYGCDEATNPLDTDAVQQAVDDGGPQFAKGGKGKGGGGGDGGQVTPEMQALGGLIFADEDLSLNRNQSCQTCHHPDEGFAAPLTANTQGSVVEGSVSGEFGDRKPPSAAYATQAPVFGISGNSALGGTFWDGRATGELLGSPAADQALGPFLNPKEQALPSSACVVYRVCTASYSVTFEDVWGDGSCPALPDNICSQGSEPSLDSELETAVAVAYGRVGLSVAAFEASEAVNAFSSVFDAGQMSALASEGEKLFSSKGKCAQCHDSKGGQPLFTDFQYHNLGVPRNPENPVYGYGMTGFDPGLGGHTGSSAHIGKFKTPTVRNVAEGSRRTYMHNGSLVSLRHVVQFYNTRDVLPVCEPDQMNDAADLPEWGPDGAYGCWPPPEYPENLDTKRMGDLALTNHEVDALVAFMGALTDQ